MPFIVTLKALSKVSSKVPLKVTKASTKTRIKAPIKALTKARTLDKIITEFSLIKDIIYILFQPKQKRPIQALLPPTFSLEVYLYDYFTLFFTPDLFSLIITNTNQYVNIQ